MISATGCRIRKFSRKKNEGNSDPKRRESPNNEVVWLFFLVTALPDNMRKNLPKRMSSHFDVKKEFRLTKKIVGRCFVPLKCMN